MCSMQARRVHGMQPGNHPCPCECMSHAYQPFLALWSRTAAVQHALTQLSICRAWQRRGNGSQRKQVARRAGQQQQQRSISMQLHPEQPGHKRQDHHTGSMLHAHSTQTPPTCACMWSCHMHVQHVTSFTICTVRHRQQVNND